MTVNIYEMSQTWNEGATTFTAIEMDVTDTASAADSKLLDLLVGGSSKFNVGKDGSVFFAGYGSSTAPGLQFGQTNGGFYRTADVIYFVTPGGAHRFGFSNAGIELTPAGKVAWSGATSQASGTKDLILERDAANTLAQRNGANAQIARLYNMWTDASNGEWLEFGWSGNVASIAPKANGTGTARVLHISGLPTSNPGAGILWNDSGSVVVGT